MSEVTKLEEELQRSELKERKSSISLSSVFLFIALIIVSFLFYVEHSSHNKTEESLQMISLEHESAKKERDILEREVSHLRQELLNMKSQDSKQDDNGSSER